MKGAAIIAAFILIVVGTLIVGGFLLYISRQSFMTKELNNSIRALYIAEAGLERKLYEIQQGNYSDIDETPFPGDDDPNNDPNITYEVEVEDEGPMYTITSTGKYYNAGRVIEVNPDDTVVKGRVVEANAEVIGIWDSAVFLGGVASGQIHGNTQIRGTVYVLGEESFVDANENNLWDGGETLNDNIHVNGFRDGLWPSETALNGGPGAFYIGNNYDSHGGNNGINAPQNSNIEDRIDTDWDLYAELNVKYGQVGLQGSAQVGDDGEEMELVNVVDGFDPEDAPLEGPGQSVFTDRLLENRSRFPDELRFPSLSDIVGGVTRMQDLYNNAFIIDSSLNITPHSITDFGDPDVDPFYKIGDTITIADNTIVYINGDLTLDRSGGNRDLYYSGNGSIVITGDIEINTNLVTSDTNPPDSIAYPDNNIIGFMTPGNIDIATGPGASGLELMAIFYAEGTINIDKQSSIAGSLVSNNLTVNQVPEVFQVNNLSDNLPAGMIDIPPVVIIDSWHEVFGGEE